MDSRKLNDWLQVIGLFGVLGGLIFVGMQLLLDRQVAVTDQIAQVVDGEQYWAELVAEYPDVWVKGISGATLSEIEAAQFEALATAFEVRYYAGWVRASQLGLQPARRFAREAAIDFSRYPGLMAFWQRRQQRMQRAGSGDQGWPDQVNEEISRLNNEVSAN
jgi:hypothetical protein